MRWQTILVRTRSQLLSTVYDFSLDCEVVYDLIATTFSVRKRGISIFFVIETA